MGHAFSAVFWLFSGPTRAQEVVLVEVHAAQAVRLLLDAAGVRGLAKRALQARVITELQEDLEA